ncbi:MAG: EBNA-1 nuclear protein [Sphingopyxis sp. RIFCSPHIGHO2_01_FULL_65_24]|nr:MAG: EBNA-1 nuclear protein [Sphingopyxis sp. RIFCSPHIGHO2_01_FULL_65_24]
MNAPTGRLSDRLTLPQPYLLFLGDTREASFAKTAFGLADWAADRCVGEFSAAGCTVTTGLPRLDPAAAKAAGARSLVIGVANQGGVIGESWVAILIDAMEAGLDIISGLHVRLANVPALAEAARRTGQRLIDVRTPPSDIPIGTGRKRTGKRLLTVGTDCALGKKYTALALHRVFVERGLDADFRATGQTGIMIAGGGIPMDAVVSDFEAGAAEILSPDAPADHWDLIEGQGSIFNPAYAAVSLGLLHGSQPDVFVVCHDPSRTVILGMESFALPTVEEVIDLTIRLGSRTNPAIRCGGISLNTSSLGTDAAEALMAAESRRLGLPVADPIRGGAAFAALVDSCLA